MTEIIIAASIGFIFYTYLGYPLLLWGLARRPPRTGNSGAGLPPVRPAEWPAATVVIAAYNEADTIGETIASVLTSDYPPKLLDVQVVSDASSDRTDQIVARFPSSRVRLLRQPVRQGQSAGLLRGARAARGKIVVLADASGRFFPDTVRMLTRHFGDPRVGGVSGHKVIRTEGTAVSKGDAAYLDYDTTLRHLESRTGSSWVGCQGGLFAVRKELFRLDFPLQMAADNGVCYGLYERGFLHRFDPAAKVLERPSRDLWTEFRRKVRIIVLGMHGLFYFRRLCVPWRHRAFFFQNASHKLFRWICPFALIALWVACGLGGHPWARAAFILQCGFYAAALTGLLCEKRRFPTPRFFSIPAYFTTVNLAGLCAWAALSRRYVIWTPPVRS